VASTRYPMRPVAWFHVVADSEITTPYTVKRVRVRRSARGAGQRQVIMDAASTGATLDRNSLVHGAISERAGGRSDHRADRRASATAPVASRGRPRYSGLRGPGEVGGHPR
jgi:hypothetical protein